MLNLLNNAVKFSPEGIIRVHVKLYDREDNTFLSVSVQDQGIGMTDEEIKNVFTPFNRSVNTVSQKLNPLGNGVGLSICKSICK